MLIVPLRMLGMWLGQAQRAIASGERVLELLDLEPELADPPDPTPLPADGGGAIRFEDVRFGYDEDRPIVVRRRPRHPGRLDRRADRPHRLRQDHARPRSCRASTTSRPAACWSTASTSATWR